MTSQEFILFLTEANFNVFPDANHLPDLDEWMYPALFVFGTGGSASDPDLPIQFPAFQVIIKGKSYKLDPTEMAKTEAIAQSLIEFLDQRTNYRIGGNTIYYSRAQQTNPIPIGLDIHDRPTFSTNFNFKLQPNVRGAS